MLYPNFSVLMSLYKGEKAQHFIDCMDSLLGQTVMPSEIVVVVDGPISDELEEALTCYAKRCTSLKIVRFSENRGLGPALADGVLACSNQIIARMDTDDISRSDRFERQLQIMVERNLDICGSYIAEFEDDMDEIVSIRRVPQAQEEIEKYQRQRSAFNHMTVMYKKEAVLRAGNYEDCPLMEDDLLWVRMLLTGARCANIADCLVYARIGSGMIERRGGSAYFRKYRRARKTILRTGYISYWDYEKTILVQFLVSHLPVSARAFLFKKMLR